MTRRATAYHPARVPFAPLQFFVPGHAKCQGNHRISASGHIYDSVQGLAPWRQTIAQTCLVVRSLRRDLLFPLTSAVAVTLHFALARPQKPTKSYPRLDVDKLARACLDALVHGRLLHDDAQVQLLHVTKAYAAAGVPCGCHFTLTDVEDAC